MFNRLNYFSGILLLIVSIISTTTAVIVIAQQKPLSNPEISYPPDSPAPVSSPDISGGNMMNPSIIAVPLNFPDKLCGLALIDRQNQTMCLYQCNFYQPESQRLKLVAVRNFRYDMMLQDFNNDAPRPDNIYRQVMQIRQAQQHNPKNSDSQTAPDLPKK